MTYESSFKPIMIWACVIAMIYGGAFVAVCWELLVHDPY